MGKCHGACRPGAAWIALAALAAIGLGTGVADLAGGARVASAAPPPPTIMVLYFDNDTADPAFEPLGKGLADMMITSLSGVPSVQVVERARLEALLTELKLQRKRFFDPRTAQKLGHGLGAQYAVVGSFVSVAAQLQINVRVIRVGTGELVKATKVTGAKEAFFALQEQLAAQLADGLSSVLTEGDRKKVKAATAANRVDNVKSLVDYGRGLDLRDQGQLEAASQQMQSLMTSAPGFTLARSRYMEVMRDLLAAKKNRGSALSDNARKLEAHVAKELAALPLDDHQGERANRYLGYRVLRGQLVFRQLGELLDKAPAAYVPRLKEYVDNQRRLIDEHRQLLNQAKAGGYAKASGFMFLGAHPSIDEGDEKMASELGIEGPGGYSNLGMQGRYWVADELVNLIIFGRTPNSEKFPEKFDDPICFYQADRSLADTAFALLEAALLDIPRQASDASHRDFAFARTLRLYSDVYLRLGKTEDAVSKLQTLLTRYPKEESFAENEQQLRAILEGAPRLPRCVAPPGAGGDLKGTR